MEIIKILLILCFVVVFICVVLGCFERPWSKRDSDPRPQEQEATRLSWTVDLEASGTSEGPPPAYSRPALAALPPPPAYLWPPSYIENQMEDPAAEVNVQVRFTT